MISSQVFGATARRLLSVLGCMLAALGLGACQSSRLVPTPRAVVASPVAASPASGGAGTTSGEPAEFRERGRLVCIPEEMKRLYLAKVAPVHDHVPGFRVEGKGEDRPRYLTILRTRYSEALFVDERFEEPTLLLSGRVFPHTGVLEVSGWQWIRDGKLFDVYYWCEVCAIRGVDPGPCACCQGKVILREKEISATPEAESGDPR